MRNATPRAIAILAALACIPAGARAESGCVNDRSRIDVCVLAQSIAAQLAASLPQRLNRSTVLEAVASRSATIRTSMRLAYDRMQLRSMYDTVSSNEVDVQRQMSESAKRSFCSEDASPTATFIRLGGVVHQQFMFVDGEPFFEAAIDTCA